MFFIKYKKLFVIIGAVLLVGSAAIVATLGLPFGIDFTGGSLTEVAYDVRPDKAEIDARVAELELGEVSIRGSLDDSGKDAYFIRTRDLSETERTTLHEAVTTIGEGGEVSRFTTIGPVIGQELQDKAAWAVGAVALVIVFYVAFAFAGIGTPVSSWIYGLVTIFILIHDILVPTALMSVLGQAVGAEVDVLFVTALLAILGYSVNDTIVIFDRVRENLKQNRTEHKVIRSEPGQMDIEEVEYTLTAPYDKLVGSAVDQSLGRSINTSVTTFLALLALYIFGGAVTQNFALILMVGVVAGAYSSICFAAPLVVMYEEWKRKKEAK